MTKKTKLTDITELFKDFDIEALEGVTIEGDIELNITGGGGLNPALAYALGQEISHISLHMANIGRILGYPVDQLFAQALGWELPVPLRLWLRWPLQRPECRNFWLQSSKWRQ